MGFLMVNKKYSGRALLKFRRTLSQDDGVSLVEAAIGLVVLGLLAMPILLAKQQELISEVRNINYGSISNAKEGINQFYASGNGAYPCPANLYLGENDTDYGISSDCTFASVLECSDPDWKLAVNGGICKTDSSPEAIIIGALPFATLKMPQGQALDYWGNKLIYAVTHKQTDISTYTNYGGEINVLAADDPEQVHLGNEDGDPDLVPRKYDIFIFSTGLNALGGYTKDGNETQNCGGALDGYDHENCDFDNLFMIDRNPDVNTGSLRSDVAGANYYDDWASLQEVPPVSTWFQHEDNPSYPNDYVLTLSTKVGVGTTTPGEGPDPGDTDATVSLDVTQDIRVEADAGVGGRIKSDSICNEDNCFDPNIITGVSMDMTCAGGVNPTYPKDRPVTELSLSSVKCTSITEDGSSPIGNDNILRVDTGQIPPGACPTGDRAIGFDATGAILCATF